jgi:hypothetical protein
LEKYEQFRRKFDPAYASKTAGSGGGGVKIAWPGQPGAGAGGPSGNMFGNQGGNRPAAGNDDDMYS